ncbi:MAG: toll/interleukin-1 receptor domain-containing protein [Hyphomonadaceae bacterium]
MKILNTRRCIGCREAFSWGSLAGAAMAREAIFIGYRRDDTADVAGRIFDALEARFGRARVFKDVDNIPVGADFGQYIKGILPRCRVALILIGPHWADAKDGSGRPRLEDPSDWVRIEVETALATPKLQVVPVLLNGAQMPRAEQLPASLQPLLTLNAAVIRRDPDFRDDIDRLGAALRASLRTGLLDLDAVSNDRRPPPPLSRAPNFSATGRRILGWLLVGGLTLATSAIAVVAFVGRTNADQRLHNLQGVAIVGYPAVAVLVFGLIVSGTARRALRAIWLYAIIAALGGAILNLALWGASVWAILSLRGFVAPFFEQPLDPVMSRNIVNALLPVLPTLGLGLYSGFIGARLRRN